MEMQVAVARIKHFFYYLISIVAGLFFLVRLTLGWQTIHLSNDPVVKSTAALVMFMMFFVLQTDKAYVVGSIPLRVIMFTTCCLGLVAVVLSMGLI